jgi:replicative DNA helicase
MTTDPTQLFWTPAELSNLAVEYYDYIGTTPGVQWSVLSMRDMLAWRPGTIIALVARPGHGKTTVSAFKAMETAQQIVRERKQAQECVLYVSLDQAVDELEALFFAGDDYSATDYMETSVPREVVVGRSLKRPDLPIWTMGKSVLRRRSTPRMTIDVLYSGIEAMEQKYGVKPRLIIVDYVQIVPAVKASERTQQVSEAVIRGGELALNVGCPILFDAQASRAAEQRDDRMPTLADCQHSSQLEQDSDVVLTAQRPWLLHRKRTINGQPVQLELNGERYPITEDLFLLRVEKQRFKGAGKLYVLRMLPQYVRLADMELERAEPDFGPAVQEELL